LGAVVSVVEVLEVVVSGAVAALEVEDSVEAV
jgi:hypothetical protein